MVVLVTGAAGFIGYHVCHALAGRGEAVVGLDSVNAYYGTDLKRRRLAELSGFRNFSFHEGDIADENALAAALGGRRVRQVIHLAAQANVRYALENPRAYVTSNVAGHLNVLEFCRHSDGLEQLIYASSSSVYGPDNPIPFSERDATDRPASLYAATKKADEMMSAVYSDLFSIRQTGLRFFSVYGPWGRPDMAYWLFTEAILAGKPITVFNEGEMRRDFTYIDDIVAGIIAVLDRSDVADRRHSIYNLGNGRPVKLLDMIRILEKAIGRDARIEFAPLSAGEMPVTAADITAIERDFAFRPTTPLEEGLPKFVEWFRWYSGTR